MKRPMGLANSLLGRPLVVSGASVVGGASFYNKEAIQIIAKIAVAAGRRFPRGGGAAAAARRQPSSNPAWLAPLLSRSPTLAAAGATRGPPGPAGSQRRRSMLPPSPCLVRSSSAPRPPPLDLGSERSPRSRRGGGKCMIDPRYLQTPLGVSRRLLVRHAASICA